MKHKNLPENVVAYVLKCSNLELSDLTRKKIARHFSINESYLSRIFKKGTNLLLFEFLESIKIRRAEILLITRPDLTIKEISEMIGVCKPSQFRKKFKKYFGINPHKYRKIIK